MTTLEISAVLRYFSDWETNHVFCYQFTYLPCQNVENFISLVYISLSYVLHIDILLNVVLTIEILQMLTAMAFKLFADEHIDIAVVEVRSLKQNFLKRGLSLLSFPCVNI